MLTEDGTCSVVDEMAPVPYDLGVILGGRSEQTTRRLALLERLVERAQETTGADWVGVYQRRTNSAGVPVLVKVAYVGRPSRGRVPAHPGLRRAQHQQHRGAHRPLDRDRRRRQACRGGRRLLRLRRRRAVGGVRADPGWRAPGRGHRRCGAKARAFFGAERLAVVAALALVSSAAFA
jgi:hypothetical protein